MVLRGWRLVPADELGSTWLRIRKSGRATASVAGVPGARLRSPRPRGRLAGALSGGVAGLGAPWVGKRVLGGGWAWWACGKLAAPPGRFVQLPCGETTRSGRVGVLWPDRHAARDQTDTQARPEGIECRQRTMISQVTTTRQMPHRGEASQRQISERFE